jgi:hypothetical protein
MSAKARSGSQNGRWRGEAAAKNSIHQWLDRQHPKKGACSDCGREGKTHRAFLRHPESYTRNPDDYRELCSSCHQRMDTMGEFKRNCEWAEALLSESAA